jgi:hypothetical protein
MSRVPGGRAFHSLDQSYHAPSPYSIKRVDDVIPIEHR